MARKGWVHLAVKPANIIVNAAPRLLDFELARPAASATSASTPGSQKCHSSAARPSVRMPSAT